MQLLSQSQTNTSQCYLHVFSSLQQTLIKTSCPPKLFLFQFKVNIRLPQHFGHLQSWLIDGQLQDCSSAVCIPENCLHFSKLKQQSKHKQALNRKRMPCFDTVLTDWTPSQTMLGMQDELTNAWTAARKETGFI